LYNTTVQSSANSAELSPGIKTEAQVRQ